MIEALDRIGHFLHAHYLLPSWLMEVICNRYERHLGLTEEEMRLR